MKLTPRGARVTAGLTLLVTLLLTGCAAAPATTPKGAMTPATSTPSAPGATHLHGTITRTLRLAEAPAACPVDAAWSPSGAQVAVLATRDTCLVRPAAKMPDLIIIYDARSGAIVHQINLAATLTQKNALVMIEPRFGFSGLSWSPDGSKIAVPIYQYIVLSSDPWGMGILVISVQSGAVRALTGPSNFGPGPIGIHPRYTGATVWNVQSGTQAATVAVPLGAARAYQWSADGHITPVQSTATSASRAQFSYWQPGFIAAIPTKSSSAGYAVWYFFTAAFTRWSPDSHYVVTGLMTMNKAGASPGAPTSIDPNNCQAEFWPQPCFDQPTPAADAAFRAVMGDVNRTAEARLYPNDAPVAWRPDGAVLAAVLPGDDATNTHRAITITLLETASGQVTGAITISTQAKVGNTGMTHWPYFAWSPMGNQLAVVNAIDNTVEIVAIS